MKTLRSNPATGFVFDERKSIHQPCSLDAGTMHDDIYDAAKHVAEIMEQNATFIEDDEGIMFCDEVFKIAVRFYDVVEDFKTRKIVVTYVGIENDGSSSGFSFQPAFDDDLECTWDSTDTLVECFSEMEREESELDERFLSYMYNYLKDEDVADEYDPEEDDLEEVRSEIRTEDGMKYLESLLAK